MGSEMCIRDSPHTEPGAALANIVQAHQPFKRGGPIAKTSQGTSSNEEFPMGNTSRSTSGWRIEPQESLLPIPNTESEIVDIAGKRGVPGVKVK